VTLVKACLNGRRGRAEHPAVPVTAAELAAAARGAADAGAGAVHVHPRRPDASESLGAAEVGAAVGAIRAACPGLPVGVTTGAWIAPELGRRLAAIDGWDVLPDFASVNLHEDGALDVARHLLELGVGVEAGLASVEDARTLAAAGLADRCLRVLVEVPQLEPADAVAAAAAIEDELGRLGIGAPQLHHGYGPATWAVIGAGRDHGHDVRIGLEDTIVLPDGTTARDNADLVRQALS
jgi:uncharacterized protein (DUF849 family)